MTDPLQAFLTQHPLHFQYFNIMASASTARAMLGEGGPVGKVHTHVDPDREYLNFSTSNYLGFSQHPDVVQAAKSALDKYGTGSNGSPVLSGYYDLHQQLEQELANLYETDAALVCSSGFSANIIALTTLLSKDFDVYIDQRTHGSIFFSAGMSGCKLRVFDGTQPDSLVRKLKASKPDRKRAILTCGVFSMTGEIAPLPELRRLADQYDAMLVVDDAHGFGVLGQNGFGSLEHFGMASDQIDLMIGTMSKTLGGCGGYITGRNEIINKLRISAPPYLLSASIPPSVAAGALAALSLLRSDGSKLAAHVRKTNRALANILSEFEMSVDGGHAAISALVTGNLDSCAKLARGLQDNGVLAHGISAPGVRPGHERIRFNVMAKHSMDDVEVVAATLRQLL